MSSAEQDCAIISKKKQMKRLTCRKCEGHGLSSILKGHAASCPFNDCQCDTCSSVMSMRANALIRRFRHRQPTQNAALLRTIRSKNGNMRLRIVAKAENMDDPMATTVTYSDEATQLSSPTFSSGASSPSSSLNQSSSASLSPCMMSPSLSPVPSTDLILMEYLQQLLHAQLLNNLLQQQQDAAMTMSAPVSPLSPFSTPLSPLLMQSFLLPQMLC